MVATILGAFTSNATENMWFDLQAIRKQWDEAAEAFEFPMLDNGYYYHADQKLTVYRDPQRWVMLVQLLQFSNHEYDLDGFTTMVYAFGNCLYPTAPEERGPDAFAFATERFAETFLDDRFGHAYLNPAVKSILVKGQQLEISHDPALYASKGIALKDGKIRPWELLRSLVPEHSARFWVTPKDIPHRIPADIPEMLTIYNWQHPKIGIGQSPTASETFWQLSKVIAMGDESYFEPSDAGNTHWKNWPQGGTF